MPLIETHHYPKSMWPPISSFVSLSCSDTSVSPMGSSLPPQSPSALSGPGAWASACLSLCSSKCGDTKGWCQEPAAS